MIGLFAAYSKLQSSKWQDNIFELKTSANSRASALLKITVL
jgi:hypothetical protein